MSGEGGEGIDRALRPEVSAPGSRAALLACFPQLEGQLPDGLAALLVVADGVGVDVALGTGRLYRGDARAIAAQQIETYRRAPFRVFRHAPGGENLFHGIGLEFMAVVQAQCRSLLDRGLTLTDRPDEPGGTLVVFGVGLGYHLDALIEMARPRRVVLVEPVPEFLALSCHTVDWQRFFDHHHAAGRRFTLLTATTESELVEQVILELAADGAIHLDGALLFIHYPAELFQRVRDQLPAHYERVFAATGFFEDELIMLVNTLANCAHNRFALVPAAPLPRRLEPAILVGAGPSLDRDLEDLRRLRPGAVLISCGTALQNCLSHGLVPDFHLECENAPEAVTILGHTAGKHPFTGITLVAALTVDPRLPPMFDDVLMYVRPYVAASTMVGLADQAMVLAFPTAVNAGARLAVSLGFRELYLFGADFGTRVAGLGHAGNTVYQDLDFLIAEEQDRSLPVEAPANFGGTIKTDVVYAIGLDNFKLLIRHSGSRVFNCSDGARIDGAEPRLAAAVRLPPLRRGSRATRDEVVASLPRREPGAVLFPDRLVQLTLEHRRFFATLLDLIDRAAVDGLGIMSFWDTLLPLLDRDGYQGVPALTAGTLKGMARYSAFFLTRIPDRALRHTLFQAILPELRRLVVHMCDRSAHLLESGTATRDLPERSDAGQPPSPHPPR